jgi:hypothetical protein
VSNKDIQRELIAGNSADFRMGDNSPADDSDDVLSLTIQSAVSQKPAAQDESKKDGKQSGANRRELRQQTASQSVQLNAQPGPGQSQAANAAQPSRPAAKEIDADKVLEQSAAKGLKDNSSFLMSDGSVRFSQSGQLHGRRLAGMPGSAGKGRSGGVGGGARGYAQPLVAGSGTDLTRTMGFGGQVTAGDGAEKMIPMFGFAVQESAGWTAAGGLSLDVTVPQEGQKLTFSKSGGDARLALGVRPRASLEVGFGLGWAIVWSLVGLGLIAAVGRADALAALVHRMPLLAIGVGLAWYFLLPAGPLGFALFVLGAVSFGWQNRRSV